MLTTGAFLQPNACSGYISHTWCYDAIIIAISFMSETLQKCVVFFLQVYTYWV